MAENLAFLAQRALRALEQAGEWGYVEGLREAIEADQRAPGGDLTETAAELGRCLSPLREYAQAFELTDMIEEALA